MLTHASIAECRYKAFPFSDQAPGGKMVHTLAYVTPAPSMGEEELDRCRLEFGVARREHVVALGDHESFALRQKGRQPVRIAGHVVSFADGHEDGKIEAAHVVL